jgi:hypothetical protein
LQYCDKIYAWRGLEMIRKLFALIMFLLSLGAIVMALFGVVVIWKNDTLDSIASLGSASAKEEYTGLMLFFGKTNKDHLLNFAQNWLGYAVIGCLLASAVCALLRVIMPGTGGDILDGILILASLGAGILLLLVTQKFAIKFDLDNCNALIRVFNGNTQEGMYKFVSGDLAIGAGAILGALCCLANVVLGVLDTMVNRRK